jgi:hypothetical protein
MIENDCNSYSRTIGARAVYVGARVDILEDTAAPLAGAMDAEYRALGQTFDTLMFGILESTFGNPLAWNANLDADGKLVIVASERVNDRGVRGYATSCDFYPPSVARASNFGEVVYIAVPTGLTSSEWFLSLEGWRRGIEATVIHEAKHVTSYAERFLRGSSWLEQRWLEEGSARVAEELLARAYHGLPPRGNTNFAASLGCELSPEPGAGCRSDRQIMETHFAGLRQYLSATETRSPLGFTTGDYSFYASTWSILRWAADHYFASDAALLKPLVQEGTLTGVANLEARLGRPWAEIVADWTLALALDDLPGFAPRRAQHALPSWNLRDVFAGLHLHDPEWFPTPYPHARRPLTYGAFAVTVPTLRAGSMSTFELSGTPAGPQLLELLAADGGAPASELRIAIVRLH